jgi:ribosomal-protein-alanine N-acetyltransferase
VNTTRTARETVLDVLHTERLILRARRAEEAAVYRRLWAERDPRVPAHRRIDAEGRPTTEDIAARISVERTGLFAVERRDTGEVIGYCGLVFADDASRDDPELAFELLRASHGRGYATEAGHAVVAWAAGAGHRRLSAHVWDWNLPSRRVLEKLSFAEVGEVGPASAHGRNLRTVREL